MPNPYNRTRIRLLSEMTRLNTYERTVRGLAYDHPDKVALRDAFLRVDAEWKAMMKEEQANG